MKIETLWVSSRELPIAVSAIINNDLANEVCDVIKLDETSNGYEIMDEVNSFDDGYFPNEYNVSNRQERDNSASLIDEFMNDYYDDYYAFFIKEKFCGFIKCSL